MPCRALEAFRRWAEVWVKEGSKSRLNALSGIGGVQTTMVRGGDDEELVVWVLMPCRALEAFRPRFGGQPYLARGCLNALSGIGGVQTPDHAHRQRACKHIRLNALSGIGGVQTYRGAPEAQRPTVHNGS